MGLVPQLEQARQLAYCLLPCEDTRRNKQSAAPKRTLPRTQHPDFTSPPKLIKNKFLFFYSHQFYGTSLQQSNYDNDIPGRRFGHQGQLTN